MVLSQTAEDSGTDFSQFWLVEAIDRASGIYTMRNVATGAQMLSDSPEQDSTLYSDAQSSRQSIAGEANEWQFSTIPGNPASFTYVILSVPMCLFLTRPHQKNLAQGNAE